ncbi:MAG: acetyltransferase [Opitutales bacterium]
MLDVLILGAGGFAREVFAWARQHPECGARWRLAGFLDDNADALNGYDLPVGIVGPLTGHVPQGNEVFLIGLGLPKAKIACVPPLRERGASFLRLVHPSVVLGQRVHLGQGVVVCPGAVLTSDVEVGDFAMINCNATVGHDAVVGAWSTLSGHVDITGYVKVGEGVFFGTRASVIPGKQVGDGATVGAGAVVIRNVPEEATVFGNPARVLG